MPRALVVCPGPEFSVADVYHGWIKGLQLNGYDVMPYNLGDRLTWAHHAHLKAHDGEFHKAFPELDDVAGFGVSGISKAAYYWWPELVVFISGFFIDPELVQVMQARNCKVVCVFTESPYEDTRQLAIADTFDAVMVNDPVRLDAYTARTTALYSPHCYDPDIHHPGPSDHKSDVAFVGTGYPSRQAFMEARRLDRHRPGPRRELGARLRVVAGACHPRREELHRQHRHRRHLPGHQGELLAEPCRDER